MRYARTARTAGRATLHAEREKRADHAALDATDPARQRQHVGFDRGSAAARRDRADMRSLARSARRMKNLSTGSSTNSIDSTITTTVAKSQAPASSRSGPVR